MADHCIFAASLAVLMAMLWFTAQRSGLLLRTWLPPTNLMLRLPDNLARLLVLVCCLAIGVTVGPGPAALGWGTTYLGQDLALGGLAGLVLAAGLNLGGQAAVKRWGPGVYSTRLLQCMLPVNTREWVGLLLALLPAAAVEELLFRSLPLGGLGWLVPPWWLMWPLAVLFGSLHWPQGGWGVVGTAIAAIALSLLFLATGSIWTAVAAHYVMNVVQIAAAKRMGLAPLRAAG